jgi:hypothetical protein
MMPHTHPKRIVPEHARTTSSGKIIKVKAHRRSRTQAELGKEKDQSQQKGQ